MNNFLEALEQVDSINVSRIRISEEDTADV